MRHKEAKVNKWLLVGLIVLVMVLAGCNHTSSKDRTSDTDILSANTVKLIDVSVDSRDFSTTEVKITTCPAATDVGSGSCNALGVP